MRRDEGTTTLVTKKLKSWKNNTFQSVQYRGNNNIIASTEKANLPTQTNCDKKEGNSGSNAIDISDSEDITHNSYQDSGQLRGLMNLVALTPADIETLQEGNRR